jgi:hypothetical protein
LLCSSLIDAEESIDQRISTALEPVAFCVNSFETVLISIGALLDKAVAMLRSPYNLLVVFQKVC